ncbi:unnamed protein product [Vitrella brassicaformis CCMP3155]|uniref:Calcium-dependent protein kinase 1 n=1 Tax=Vitrella brassicaformis (strain CCMP3155) TaxID=1169540 RepID=A0A0G4ELZ6_VITBC|nr:unnamed protein product [Vitrella brassicaformis CCMP3155]|eukprot:CEL97997.1 unnamed protein product [Vitrella brassicaformis CCMP3155]
MKADDEGPADSRSFQLSRDKFILSSEGPLTRYYDLEKKNIGQGTYGSVCKAVNKSTGAVRAIKTISKSQVKNIERFRTEIAIMKQLDHPNIVKLYETFEDAKNIYLVLELCTGGELFDRIIEAGFFTEKQASTIMRQILAALFYLHSQKIMHRDLKPENFLFLNKAADSPLKIIDFGLAARICSDKVATTKAGTPYYVAPQVLQGKYDQACDLWSAGVIMYIFLCGYPPFHGDTDAEILQKVKSGKFQFQDTDWKHVSAEAKDLIRKLLTFSPKDRLTAANSMSHPWIKNVAASAPQAAINKNLVDNFRVGKRAALTVIAQQLTDNEIDQLKKIFIALDNNGDGTLTTQEVKEGLSKSGLKELPQDLEQIMMEVDSDGSGVIDYTEFIAATLEKKHYIKEDVCWAAFRVLDLDGNGRITAEELKKVLGMDQIKGAFEKRNLDEIKKIIEEHDTNGDGEIDFQEFLHMLRVQKS